MKDKTLPRALLYKGFVYLDSF